MKAMILCAGLGTRLKPWTLEHPKALVPVEGVPMLERVILKLKSEGVTEFVVNVHHFANQIIDFINTHDFGVNIRISDESGDLLDTGGAIMHAAPMLWQYDSEPAIIYNVDILSNANVGDLLKVHSANVNDATLLVSPRESSRKLLFDGSLWLKGWHNNVSGEYIPDSASTLNNVGEYAFSGIYAVSESLVGKMRECGMSGKFPIIPFLVRNLKSVRVGGYLCENLSILDIGKPETLFRASEFLHSLD